MHQTRIHDFYFDSEQCPCPPLVYQDTPCCEPLFRGDGKHQTRLDDYFSTVVKPYSSRICFLDLPISIRERIYGYVLDPKCPRLDDHAFVDLSSRGLRVFAQSENGFSALSPQLRCECDLNDLRLAKIRMPEGMKLVWILDDDWEVPEEIWYLSCTRSSLHPNIFQVSKAVLRESIVFLYSRNPFYVSQHGPLGLTRLQQLSSDALAAMTSLTIRLNPYECTQWNNTKQWPCKCMNDVYTSQPKFHLIKDSKQAFKMTEWNNVVGRLAQCIRPRQLSLCIICDAADVETYREMVEPLLLLPTLKECGIRHSSPNMQRNLSMQELSRNIVLQLVRRDAIPPFPYLKLPQELRLNVLEYTNLVPAHVIQWQPSHPLASLNQSSCPCFGSVFEETGGCFGDLAIDQSLDRLEPRFLYRCCSTCRIHGNNFDHGALHPRQYSRGGRDAPDLCNTGCICSRRICGYSSQCSCTPQPHPLFFVSRQVHEDTEHVFYSKNHFLIMPSNSPSLDPDDPYVPFCPQTPERVELSMFLALVSQAALQHIRWLEWVLPQSRTDYLAEPGSWAVYLDTLDLMKRGMKLTQLTFVVNMVQPGTECWYKDEERMYQGHIEMCSRLVAPMQRLNGLKDLFIYVGGPGGSKYDELKMYYEQTLEQSIMGPNYSSLARGKPAGSRFGVHVWRVVDEYY